MEDRVKLVKKLGSAGVGEGDLNLAFYSACALLGVNNYFVDARFEEFASLKALLRVKENTIVARVSDGFKAASQDVITGLAIYLVSKAFNKRVSGEETVFLSAYKEFVSKKATSGLSDSLRRLRGRARVAVAEGNRFNLKHELFSVAAEYAELFNGIDLPEISWSREKSRRTLGYHDSALNRVVISKLFDSPSVPGYVLRYLIFHELLHCKHEVLYQRGESLRRTVHSKRFKNDEKKFKQFREATEWIDTKLPFLR